MSSYSSSSSLVVFRLGCHEPLLLVLALIGVGIVCCSEGRGVNCGDIEGTGAANGEGEGERERLWLLIALLASLEEVENFRLGPGPTGMVSA